MAILRIRGSDGNVYEVLALRGEQGLQGEKGEQGIQGKDGEPGADGVGVLSIRIEEVS